MTFEPLTSDMLSINSNRYLNGNYYLSEDITISGTLLIRSDCVVNLCLNGHKLRGLDAISGTVIDVDGNGILRLCDCSGNDSGQITSDESAFIGGIYISRILEYTDAPGRLEMYGGTIKGNKRGVFISCGTFDMYGGRIIGNTSYLPDGFASIGFYGGGGVYADNSTFNMYGGIISGNRASTSKAEGYGGGVMIECDGGLPSSFNMSGGEITDNSSDHGGGIFAYSGAVLNITGGKIKDNHAQKSGGGILAADSKSKKTVFHIAGSPEITGNKCGSKDNDICLGSGTVIHMGDASTARPIGITTSPLPVIGGPVDITGEGNRDYSTLFKSDDPMCKIVNTGEGAAQVLKLQVISGNVPKLDSEGSYLLATADDLMWFADYVNGVWPAAHERHQDVNAKLTADIVLNAKVLNADGTLIPEPSTLKSWTPIAPFLHGYKGTFDGQGHTVRGLYCDLDSTDVGLFGYVDNGIIRNVTVEDSYIKGTFRVGGILGHGTGSDVVVENCVNKGTVIASGAEGMAGGIVGRGSSSYYERCGNFGSVTADSGGSAGGIAGYGSGSCTINFSYNAGAVKSSDHAGGIIGNCMGAAVKINNSYNAGAVIGTTGQYIGAIAGNNASVDNLKSCCYLAGCAVDPTGTVQGGIGTSTGSPASDSDGNVVAMDAPGFASGEVTWLLNGGAEQLEEPVWFQNIDIGKTDAYPTLDDAHGVIYRKADGTCTNYAELTHSHKGDGEWIKDASGHWKLCAVCGKKTDEGAHDGDTCSVCGYVKEPAKEPEPEPAPEPEPEPDPEPVPTEHVHAPDSTWHKDVVGHWHVCTGCAEKLSFAEHTFRDAVCSVCGYEQKETKPGGEVEDDKNIEDSPERYQTVSEAASIAPCVVNGGTALPDKVYNGLPQTQKIKVAKDGKTLKEGTDYKLFYESNVHAGKATVLIVGAGSYKGSVPVTFTIKGKPLDKLKVVTDQVAAGAVSGDPIHIFDGQYELIQGRDYSYTFTGAVKGANSVAISAVSGSDYAEGTKPLTVNVTGIKLNAEKGEKLIKASDITLTKDGWTTEDGVLTTTYDGTAKIPDVTVKDGDKTLVKGTDYTVTFQNHKNAGTAYAIVKGKGKVYKGQVMASYTIKAPDAGFSSVTVGGGKDLTFTGKLQTPSVVVKAKDGSGKEKTLKKNRDYVLNYISNINHGQGYVTVEGVGNYAGIRRTYVFNILQKDVGKVSKSIKSASKVILKYGGKTLEEGADKDYTVEISDSAKAGKKKVAITGHGNYTGTFVKDKVKP